MDFDRCPLEMRWSGLRTCFILVLLGDWSYDYLLPYTPTENSYICTSAVNLLVCKVTTISPARQRATNSHIMNNALLLNDVSAFICLLTTHFTMHNYCPNLRALLFKLASLIYIPAVSPEKAMMLNIVRFHGSKNILSQGINCTYASQEIILVFLCPNTKSGLDCNAGMHLWTWLNRLMSY